MPATNCSELVDSGQRRGFLSTNTEQRSINQYTKQETNGGQCCGESAGPEVHLQSPERWVRSPSDIGAGDRPEPASADRLVNGLHPGAAAVHTGQPAVTSDCRPERPWLP